MKLTDLKGCGKPLVTYVPHIYVEWRWRSKPKEMQMYKPHIQASKYCGDYRKSWGCRVYLCPDCIVKNGLKW